MPSRGYPPGPSYSPRQAAMEERQYQNIGLYQQQHQQQQQQLSQQPQPPVTRPSHGSQPLPWSPPTSSSGGNAPPRPEVGTRPLSTLVSPREQEQYVSSLGSLAVGHHSGPHGVQTVASEPPAHWSPPPASARSEGTTRPASTRGQDGGNERGGTAAGGTGPPPATDHETPDEAAPTARCPVTTTSGDQQWASPKQQASFPRYPRDPAQVASPSPWEREEKEMRRLQRLEEMRQMRDEELQELESLPNRTSRQEERLRTLRLEREFERRAQELAGDDDDEEQDLTSEVPPLKERPSQHPWEPVHAITPRHLEEQEDRLRQLRLEESVQSSVMVQWVQSLQCPCVPIWICAGLLQTVWTPVFVVPHMWPALCIANCFKHAGFSHVCAQDDEEEDSGYTLQDIDAVLNAPPGGYLVASTPGVIGAQEVYRDPRQRIERQRALQQPSRPPGPEKLTFREKMRMFARETGEEHTPRDKMKISRAQREIETSLNGVPTPNR
ncbi:hypothetical protein MTO96_006795 [Rhipicephalus appendiculatus]